MDAYIAGRADASLDTRTIEDFRISPIQAFNLATVSSSPEIGAVTYCSNWKATILTLRISLGGA